MEYHFRRICNNLNQHVRSKKEKKNLNEEARVLNKHDSEGRLAQDFVAAWHRRFPWTERILIPESISSRAAGWWWEEADDRPAAAMFG